MGRRIFLCAAAFFAFTMGSFAEDDDAVMVLDAVEEVKPATEAVVAEAKEEATPVIEAKEGVVQEVKEEAKAVEEAKPETAEVAKAEAIEKVEKKAPAEAPAAEEAGKEKAIEEAVAGEEKGSKGSSSWLNPMNWFSSSEGEKVEPAKEEAAPAAPVEEAKKEEAAPSVVPEVVAAEAKKEEIDADADKPGFLAHAGRAVLLWLPNRLADVTDLVSMNVSVGPEVAIEVDVTKYLGIGGASGEKYFVQKGYARQCGGGYSSGWDFQTLCLNAEKIYVEDTFGSTKKYYVNRKDYGLADYSNHSYRDRVRDFWAISVKAGWMLGFGIEVHPTEIADLVAGIFFLDAHGDDFE
jgi:hypothetical protein